MHPLGAPWNIFQKQLGIDGIIQHNQVTPLRGKEGLLHIEQMRCIRGGCGTPEVGVGLIFSCVERRNSATPRLFRGFGRGSILSFGRLLDVGL